MSTRPSETLRDANQRLEAANKALRIENVERKRAEQALRESEDKFRQIIDTDLTWSAGSNGSEGKNAEAQSGFMAQMRAVLNVLPAYVWYGTPSGVLIFVNKRQADFLGVPNDHPLRFGIDTGAQWDDWVPFLHPDEHEEARKYWSNCLRTGKGDEHHHEVQRHGDGAVDLPVYRRRPRGRLWAEANEPRGAIFQFTLPAVP